MPPKLELVSEWVHVVEALQEFNSDALRFNHQELAWDLVRRTRYWVHDVPSGTFGPGKFVGFQNMTYDLYDLAREGDATGAPFDGYQTRTAIERALKSSFHSDDDLHAQLTKWAESLVGPRVFEGVGSEKWQFVDVRADEKPKGAGKGWSEWLALKVDGINRLPKKPGGYQIRAVDEKKRARTIRRCVGDDREGLLGIGESEDLRKRISNLLRCMGEKGQGGHMAGWRYAYLEMNRIFPLERIQFRYCVTKDKDAAYKLEGTLLHDYVNRHFELPPLNYKFNWSVWDEERAERR